MDIWQMVKECKQLWREIEKSGLSKRYFLNSERGGYWKEKGYFGNCPLCAYVCSKNPEADPPDNNCESYCPLFLEYGRICLELGYSFDERDPQFFECIKGLGRLK